MLWLGVDIGGTGSRWAACDASGAVIARGAVGGASGVPDPVARRVLTQRLGEISAALPASPISAVIGMTGAGLLEDADLRAAVARALMVPAGQLWVMNDMQLAGHTAFPGEQSGHLIAAGTGSVALHKATNGCTEIIGGRGILIDDAGSGAWIGLQALKALWRRIEETGTPAGMEQLAGAVFDALGGEDWETTRLVIYGGDRGRAAALAPAVGVAAKAGDQAAMEILISAGKELARLGRVLIDRFGPAPIAAFGGVFALHPIIASTLEASVLEQPIAYPDLDFAAQAAAMALTRFPPEGS